MFRIKFIIPCLITLSIFSMLLPKGSEAAITPKEKFFKAEAAYHSLLGSPKKIKQRDNWLSCIKKFQKVYKHDPQGPWAAAGMYKVGKLYYELYKYSNKPADKKDALDSFERIITRYPKSRYRNKAKKQIKLIADRTKKKKPPLKKRKFPDKKKSKQKERKPGKSQTPPLKNGLARVKYLRDSSYPGFTRIVIEIDKDVRYSYSFLKKDPALKKPMRMYLDIESSKLSQRLKKKLPVKENRLKIPINNNLDVRISQNKPDVVRVVMYNYSYQGREYTSNNYDIKTHYNPFRIVVDVDGKTVKAEKSAVAQKQKREYSKKYTSLKKDKKITPNAIRKQLALGVKRIIIDPGHGGRDYGAPGYYKGVHEKDIVLKIAKKLAAKIRKELNYEVILTREDDRFLTLEERTRFANNRDADLFISLHANSSRNKKAYGLETYFLNLATDDDAIMVAARENATSKKNISDLQDILTDIMQNSKIHESKQLARNIQNSMCGSMKKKYDKIKNKGVKQAPFYVLIGANMPSVLIESAFISNPRECKRLTNSNYQDRLCSSIVDGIKKYIR